MKKMFKRIICSIFIIFSIFSIISLAYNYYIIKENIGQITSTSQEQGMHQETINLENNMNINKILKMNYYNGMLNILYQLLNILLISVFIGIVIGLIFSIKESSIVRYILFFVLGNLLYNILIGIIIQGIYLKNGLELTFFEAYFKSFTNTIIIYSILFSIIGIIRIIDNKRKINKLNELCKENKNI